MPKTNLNHQQRFKFMKMIDFVDIISNDIAK